MSAQVTIPPAGGVVVAQPMAIPGIGLRNEGGAFQVMGPLLTVAVTLEAAAGLFPADPTCTLFLLIRASPSQSVVQAFRLAAGAEGHLQQIPVPPEGAIRATVTGAATITGNPELVTVHYNVWCPPTDVTSIRSDYLYEQTVKQMREKF